MPSKHKTAVTAMKGVAEARGIHISHSNHLSTGQVRFMANALLNQQATRRAKDGKDTTIERFQLSQDAKGRPVIRLGGAR